MLLRKMLRDMKLHKTQFISIFLMTMLGLFIYAGVSSEWNGLKNIADKFYKETNFPDAWIYSSGFSSEAAAAVSKVAGVTGVERRLTIESAADLDNKPTVKLHFVESNKISRFRLMEGEEFSLDKDGIWLDVKFAEVRELKTGDKISFTFNGFTLEKEIKGLIMSPEYIYYSGEDDVLPTPGSYGYGFLSYRVFPDEVPIAYTDLLVTADKPVDIDLENQIDQALEGKYSVFMVRKNLRSYMQFSEEMKEHRAIGQIFPILFLSVAMLTTITTMARLVNNQRTQIGILKAVGYKKRRILFHYVSYGLWISLAGAAAGAILGPLTLPYLFYIPMKTTFTLPEWKSSIPLTAAIMLISCVAVCTLVTYLTCRNVLKDTPSESLRPKAPKDIRHSFIDRFKLWNRLDFHTQWNLRDVFRCKGRSIMAIVGVLGCSALLICAFGMQDTFHYLVKWNYEVIDNYETKFNLKDDAAAENVRDIIEKYDGVPIEEGAVELKANGKKRSGELLVTNETPLIQAVDMVGSKIKLPSGQISVSYKICELLGLEAGDKISWHLFGEEKWNTSVIGAIYRTPFTQGITVSRDFFESYGYTFIPTAVVSAQAMTGNIKDIKIDGVSKVQNKEMLIDSFNTLAQAMDILIYVLMVAAVLLAAVVIYNLGVLAFTERQRELSTLKVLGFKSKKLRSMLLTQNIWLTAVGIVLGIPVGMWIEGYIFGFVGEVFDFIIKFNFISYMYCILGTMLVSILVNRLFSKRVRKIDMVSSLKGVE